MSVLATVNPPAVDPASEERRPGLDLEGDQPPRGVAIGALGLDVCINAVVRDVLAAEQPSPTAELILGGADTHPLDLGLRLADVVRLLQPSGFGPVDRYDNAQ